MVSQIVNGGDNNVEHGKKEVEIVNKGPFYGVRHTQIILMFLLIVIGYAMRVNLSVGIVAMTDPTVNPDFPTYEWTDKSVILSSFFWGYVIPQIGAGQLAKNFGPRWALIVTMSISSLFTILIPVMAELGSYGVIICRVIQGLSQGFFFPSVHNLISKWVPVEERTRMATFVYTGGPLGTVIAMPVTGWIAASSIGWPSVFYLFGVIGFLWVISYIILGANNALEHKSISDEEREYIRMSLVGDTDEHANVPTPWLKICTSLPVWSILIAHIGQNWGFWTLLTEIPTYMNNILKYNIQDNSLLSALPYFVLWILSFVFSAASDFFINRKILTIVAARKITTFIGLMGPAIALVGLGLQNSPDKTIAIALLVLAVGINSASFAGYQLNHIDLSPQHAGTLMGITNGMANIFSIIAPLVVQFIVTKEDDPDQWKIVFFIAAGIYAGACTFYCLFGSGEVQIWDSAKPNKVPKEDKKTSVASKEIEAYKL